MQTHSRHEQATDATRELVRTGHAIAGGPHRRPTLTGIAAIGFGVLAATALVLFLDRTIHLSTAGIWLYLPLVLIVTILWGLIPGLILGAAAEILILTFLVPPIGAPVANDSMVYVRLAASALGMLAAAVTVADLNRRRHTAEQRGRREAEALADIGRHVSSSLDLNEVLARVAESGRAIVDADGAWVGLWQPDETLQIAAVAGDGMRHPLGRTVDARSGIAALALTTGRAQQTSSHAGDQISGTDAGLERTVPHGEVASALALPILRGIEPLGVLWLVSGSQRRFQDQEISILERLASHAAVAINNARSLAREQAARAEAETLAEIGRRISATLDLDDVLRTTTESARHLVKADLISAARLNPDGSFQILSVAGATAPALQQLVTHAGSGLGGRVLAAGHALQTHWNRADPDVPHEPDVLAAMEAEGIRSTLAVPILQGSDVAGMFWVHSRSERIFEDGEIALLTRLAAHVGIAIANARVHAEEQQARAEVEALLAATASLGVQDQPESVLRTLVEQAATLLQADRATYAVLRQGQLVVPAAWQRGGWVEDAHVASPGGLFRFVWESRRTYRTNHADSDPSISPGVRAMGRVHSQLTVPLLGQGEEPLGIVSVNNSRRAGGFSERDERLLLAICETGSAILMRARESAARLEAEHIAARRKQEVEALLAVADQLNQATERTAVMRRVVGIAAAVVGARRAGIATNEGDHALRHQTWLDGVIHEVETVMPLDGSVSGWVIQNRRPFRTTSLPEDPQAYPPAFLGAVPQMALSVPMLGSDGSILGSLNLFDRQDGQPFSDDDERLAEGIAHQAAVALERAHLIEESRRQAATDPLTGLPNRSLFLKRLTAALAQSGDQGHGVAVLFLDLDGFKVVNDSLGHAAGDELLRAVAVRLSSTGRAGELIARFGGDEFAILLEYVDTPSAAEAIAGEIIQQLHAPLDLHRQGLVVNASVGITSRPSRHEPCTADDLIREADIALYQAKASGKGHGVSFTPEMSAQAVERLTLQTDLQRAIERRELRLHYQPIVELGSQSVIGVEALLRWRHPYRGLLSAKSFIPVAEETGLIVPIGSWVLQEACQQAQIWTSKRGTQPPLRMSVNVSVRQLEQPDFAAQVAEALRHSGLSATQLQLEITESALLGHVETTAGVLAALRELGVRLALDDFGTGYSSLSYLQRLPVESLKIDQSFVAGIEAGGTTAAIVQAMIILGHALEMEVTAEGVEEAEHAKLLATLGCDYAQGYYFSAAREASALAGILLAPPPGTELQIAPRAEGPALAQGGPA